MATKYVSSLTGPEMDAALIDMAYHNSEAYAVGTRNGVAVGSSDVTYHNNAKYYAEQTGSDVQAAEAAAARAEAAVPSGTAGAVFFDRAQSLTTAQQEQARANIMAGGSNRNLLDNAYFVGGGSQLGDGIFPINQRGQTQYTGGGVQLDRWHGWAGTDTLVLTANGLQYTSPSSNGIFQYFPVFPTTQTVTFSVKVNGTITSITLAEGTIHAEEDFSGYKLTVDRNDKAVGIFSLNETILLQAAKLEVGTVSTLANDAPPEYAEELMKCNFYDIMLKTSAQYGYLGYGIADSATSATILIPLPNNMRDATPTITTGGTIAVKGGTSGTHTITGITFKLRVTGGVLVTVATTGLTTGEFCLLQLNNTSSYINISADL